MALNVIYVEYVIWDYQYWELPLWRNEPETQVSSGYTTLIIHSLHWFFQISSSFIPVCAGLAVIEIGASMKD